MKSLEKETLKPLFLQKLNRVGGSDVGRKKVKLTLSWKKEKNSPPINQTQKKCLNRFPSQFFKAISQIYQLEIWTWLFFLIKGLD